MEDTQNKNVNLKIHGLSMNAHYNNLSISIIEVLWFTFWLELEILCNNDKNWE